MNLSIIIPVYDTERYLRKCFESIIPLMEVLVVEVIFVNDGSPDNSIALINEFKRNYSFVKIINQDNQGLSSARNRGIKEAKGDYFILLDSDDWIEWKSIERVYHIANKKQLELVGFHLQFINQSYTEGTISRKHKLAYDTIMSGSEALIGGYQPSSSCLFMYNKNFIKSNNLQFYKGIMQEDVEFSIRLLIPAKQICFTDIVAYKYYRRNNSMTTTSLVDRRERYLLDSIIVADLIKRNIMQLNKNQISLKSAIEKNYNSVIWNLLWRLFAKPKEMSYEFKVKCISELKLRSLYPIKGVLKSSFQYFMRLIFNKERLFLFILKIRN